MSTVVIMDMNDYELLLSNTRYWVDRVFELQGETDRLREQNELATAQLTRLAEIEAENEQLKRQIRWSSSHV